MVTPHGDALERLGWISPDANSLVALVRADDPWPLIRHDPGAILLLLRQDLAHVANLPDHHSFCNRRLQAPAVFDEAVKLLDREGFADWSGAGLCPVYETAWRLAEISTQVANAVGGVDVDECWSAGMVAALGWLAMSVIGAEEVVRCLEHADFCRRPRDIEREIWGLDHTAIARRLARTWRLPAPYAVVAGQLGLPARTATALGAHGRLLQVVQLAAALLKEAGDPLHLPCPHPVQELAACLSLSPEQTDQLECTARRVAAEPVPRHDWQAPAAAPLLRDVLVLAADNRRLRQAPSVGRLEQHVDCLQATVENQDATFAQRLEECKLAAMAEFAAGAGHEINNPLAVISGQAQYLIRSLEEETPIQRLLHATVEGAGLESACSADHSTLRMPPARLRESLQKVIYQVQRIHDLLRQLMQFARPSRPQKCDVDVVALVHEVLTAHRDLALEHKVRVDAPQFGPSVLAHADPGQLRTVLNCLVKNAIEAAGATGWVAARLEREGSELLHVLIEDSGSGPDRRQRDHLFEPFYSGREAGRGHGLGLPIAWRLAREQGCSVRFVPLPHGPTRFVLTLPLHCPPEPVKAPPSNGRVNYQTAESS